MGSKGGNGPLSSKLPELGVAIVRSRARWQGFENTETLEIRDFVKEELSVLWGSLRWRWALGPVFDGFQNRSPASLSPAQIADPINRKGPLDQTEFP
jgi:hypothetical protein